MTHALVLEPIEVIYSYTILVLNQQINEYILFIANQINQLKEVIHTKVQTNQLLTNCNLWTKSAVLIVYVQQFFTYKCFRVRTNEGTMFQIVSWVFLLSQSFWVLGWWDSDNWKCLINSLLPTWTQRNTYA